MRASSVGRTRGALNDFKAQLPTLAGADKPAFGARFNAVKVELEAAHRRAARRALRGRARGRSRSTSRCPRAAQWRGAKHPVTLVLEEIEEIFRDLGFTIATGPRGRVASGTTSAR